LIVFFVVFRVAEEKAGQVPEPDRPDRPLETRRIRSPRSNRAGDTLPKTDDPGRNATGICNGGQPRDQ
jgi:hypothetical protein